MFRIYIVLKLISNFINRIMDPIETYCDIFELVIAYLQAVIISRML